MRRPTALPDLRAQLTGAAALALGCALAALSPATGAAGASLHGGGVGSCGYCHVMHGAADGQVAFDGTRPLLLAATSTDLCLTCHGENGVFGANPLAPPRELGAGNFVWLLEDNLNDAGDGGGNRIRGEAAGHSIVSPARGTAADSRWDRAPGGTFPSSALGCTSCHDPHGNTAFRMLNGTGPVQGGLGVFFYPAPDAAGLPTAKSGLQESTTAHTAYRAGISAWCANCHGFYHDEGSAAGFRHPVDVPLERGVARRYAIYNGDADPAGGSAATAYVPQVPFESAAAAIDGTAGPAAADRLNCLSCHRAHASSAPAAGRWDFRVDRLADDGRISGSYPLPSPYPAAEQGQLCRKCHGENHDQGVACLKCHGQPAPTPWPTQP